MSNTVLKFVKNTGNGYAYCGKHPKSRTQIKVVNLCNKKHSRGTDSNPAMCLGRLGLEYAYQIIHDYNHIKNILPD